MTAESAQEIADRRKAEEEARISTEMLQPNSFNLDDFVEVGPPAQQAEAKPEGKEFSVAMPIPKSLRKRFGRKAIEQAGLVHFFVFLAANADTKFGYEWDLVPATTLTPTWEEDPMRGPGARLLRVSGYLVQVPLGKAKETSKFLTGTEPISNPDKTPDDSPDQP